MCLTQAEQNVDIIWTFDSRTGHQIQGAWDKTKGKINVMSADTKLFTRDDTN